MLQKKMAALKTAKVTTGTDSMEELDKVIVNLGVEYSEPFLCD
jgi:hypothetical protein